MAAANVDHPPGRGKIVGLYEGRSRRHGEFAHVLVEYGRPLGMLRQVGKGGRPVAQLEGVLAGPDAVVEVLHLRPAVGGQKRDAADGIRSVGAKAISHRRQLEPSGAQVPDDIGGRQHPQQAVHAVGVGARGLGDVLERPGAVAETIGYARLAAECRARDAWQALAS
jgi:hypothetical protein